MMKTPYTWVGLTVMQPIHLGNLLIQWGQLAILGVGHHANKLCRERQDKGTLIHPTKSSGCIDNKYESHSFFSMNKPNIKNSSLSMWLTSNKNASLFICHSIPRLENTRSHFLPFPNFLGRVGVLWSREDWYRGWEEYENCIQNCTDTFL